MEPAQLALMIPIVALMIPVSAIWTKHLQKMAEIKAQQQPLQNNPQVETELVEMKRQMAELRDTTTRFDMSFDAALSNLENRVEKLEQENATSEHVVTVQRATEGEQVLMQGRRR